MAPDELRVSRRSMGQNRYCEVRMTTIPRKIQRELVSLLEGGSETNNALVESVAGHEVDQSELDEIMYDHGYDRCNECGIWFRVGELQTNPNDPTLYICNSCKEYA